MFMQPILTEAQRHLLRMIFDRGAEAASQALSKWLGEEVHLAHLPDADACPAIG